MIRAGVFLLLMLAGAAAPPCADAAFCKCGLQTVRDELALSHAVFLGVVVHVGEPRGGVPASAGIWTGAGIPVTLRAERAWKGVTTGDSVTVLDSSACLVGFQAGQAYVVYAVRENGELATSYCMRTRSLPHAADDVRVLDSIARAPRP